MFVCVCMCVLHACVCVCVHVKVYETNCKELYREHQPKLLYWMHGEGKGGLEGVDRTFHDRIYNPVQLCSCYSKITELSDYCAK